MKTDSIVNNVQRCGVGKERFFGVDIENAPHIFEILRNKLYSDKPRAVVRETLANAYDAHVKAGCASRPFVVHAPTRLEPEFSVRDYGPGLSEDEVFDIYIKYGTSTKRVSNDFVGQLGLGAKAPFAYTNVFTIISYYNGTKSVYTAFIDETNVGKMTKLSECPTTEPNGIEVKIAINAEDITLFRSIIEQYVAFYTVQPIINITIQPLRYVEYENDPYFSILKKEWSEHLCIMGNVVYPINLAMLDRDHEALNWIWNTGLLSYYRLLIKAQIGDVAVSASRENLEYTPKTKSFLHDRFTYISKAILQKSQDMLTSIQSEYEAACLLARSFEYDYMKKFPILKIGIDSIRDGQTILYKGKNISCFLPDVNSIDPESGKRWGELGLLTSLYILSHNSDIPRPSGQRYTYHSSFNYYNTAVVINDANKVQGRLKHLIDKIEADNPSHVPTHYFMIEDADNGNTVQKYIKNLLQGTPVYRLSDYDPVAIYKTETKKSTTKKPSGAKLSDYNKINVPLINIYSRLQSKIYTPVSKKEVKNGVYIIVNDGRRTIHFYNTKHEWSSLYYLVKELQDIIPVPDIYSIRMGQSIPDGAQSLENYIIDTIKSKYSPEDLEDSKYLTQIHNDDKHSPSRPQLLFMKEQFEIFNHMLPTINFTIPQDFRQYVLRMHYLFQTNLPIFWHHLLREVSEELEKCFPHKDNLQHLMKHIKQTYQLMPKNILANFPMHEEPKRYGIEVFEYVAAIHQMRQKGDKQ